MDKYVDKPRFAANLIATIHKLYTGNSQIIHSTANFDGKAPPFDFLDMSKALTSNPPTLELPGRFEWSSQPRDGRASLALTQ